MAITLGEWKCSITTRGERCVETDGATLMLQQSASNRDTMLQELYIHPLFKATTHPTYSSCCQQ